MKKLMNNKKNIIIVISSLLIICIILVIRFYIINNNEYVLENTSNISDKSIFEYRISVIEQIQERFDIKDTDYISVGDWGFKINEHGMLHDINDVPTSISIMNIYTDNKSYECFCGRKDNITVYVEDLIKDFETDNLCQIGTYKTFSKSCKSIFENELKQYTEYQNLEEKSKVIECSESTFENKNTSDSDYNKEEKNSIYYVCNDNGDYSIMEHKNISYNKGIGCVLRVFKDISTKENEGYALDSDNLNIYILISTY